MGTITNKISRYWPKDKIDFLKNNWQLTNKKIAKKINKQPKDVSDKRRALLLPLRECDAVPLSFNQKMILCGSLLGDGSIVRGKEDKNYRFSEAHSVKQKAYLLFKHEQLKPFSGKFIEYPGKYGAEVKFSTKAHLIFKEFREMFYNIKGRKTIKSASLNKINHPLALAIWFGDDGNKEKDSYRIATGAYSVKEIELLIKWLKNFFGIRSYLHKHGKYWYLSIREDRLKFTKLIKP
ncbi:MAG: hypothetical protein ABH831_02280, partial [Candidatus Nealsonbacteria bacterium]